ncbi:MAG: class I SAM-dependent methyltransferase [Calditrichia bacterium]
MAQIYDHIMRHVEYDRWARYVSRIIRNFLEIQLRLLDVGCGTGKLIRELAKIGIQADGCDPCEQMLEIAKKSHPDSHFWKDRLPALERVAPQQYSMITCLYDTINYLPSLQEVEETLQRMNQVLPPKGLFVFDAVSAELCQYYFHQASEKEVLSKDYAYSRHSYFDRNSSLQINEFIIYTPRGVFEEKHVQKIFAFSDIRSVILAEDSFELLGVFDGFTFCDATEDSNRAHFILKKK